MEISKFAFDPETIEVTVGTSIVWTNRDDILHTVTSGRPQEQGIPGVSANKDAKPDGTFDEQLDGSGATARVTLEKPGRYRYFCAIHPGMVARIRVTG